MKFRYGLLAMLGSIPALLRGQVTASFTAPDTVCVNTPVKIVNTSLGASTYYWNFCVANSGTSPVGTNIGTFGFSMPVFMDYALDGINYFGFVTNNVPGKLIRLNFGNSLLNTPTYTDFGDLGGTIPSQCEGVQVVRNEGKWYVLVVGGQPSGRIVKVEFGSSLAGTPTATNWGNVGNLSYPTDLHVFKDGVNWYGLTLNALTNTITRFSFSSSFSNTPTGINMGSLGGMSFPTGIHAISKNNNWYAFITNAGSGYGGSTNASLTRLDFGNSLLNMPTGTNLGNPGNLLSSARDLTIYQSCNEIFGFVVNYSNNNDIVRLNFQNNLTSIPAATSVGNIGNLSFPHSISRLFRDGNDLYAFVTNVNSNTVTRLKLNGCSASSIAASTLQNPPAVTYNAPGVYNINLSVDDGLPTQAAYCCQVVVLSSVHTPLQQKSACVGDSVLLTSSLPSGNTWSTGSSAASVYVKAPGTYWVKSSNGGCTNIDSFVVNMNPVPVVNLGADSSFCSLDSVVLNAGNTGASFLWQNGQTGQLLTAFQPGLYHVTVTLNGCTAKDSIRLATRPSPTVALSNDTTICKTGLAQLLAGGGAAYEWWPASGLSATTTAAVTASPVSTTTYHVKVTAANQCIASDSATVAVDPLPVFTASSSKPFLCVGDTATLQAAGGDKYSWSPGIGLSNPFAPVTTASPQTTISYKVVIENAHCRVKDSLFVSIPVGQPPAITVNKSNDISCQQSVATLLATGGAGYLWQPATGLSDPKSKSPTVSVGASTLYTVTVTGTDGCVASDTVTVFVNGTDGNSGFWVPTAFTPNNDGKNDCFGVQWGAVTEFSMKLYNRWGEVVFQTTDATRCWNGVYRGVQQPAAVYVFLIRAKTICGEVSRKGTFALVR